MTGLVTETSRPFASVPEYVVCAAWPLWEFRKDHITWSAELRFHGELWDWDAYILRNGDFSISRRFDLKALAVQWAELERADIEQQL